MSSTIVSSGSFLDLSGIIPFDTIEVQGTSADTDLILTANATLNNAGTILLDGADSRIYGNSGSGSALDNVNGTIDGAGQIGIGYSNFNLELINEDVGTIDANSTLQLRLFLSGSPAASNAGLIEATNIGGLLIEQSTIDNFIGTQAGTIAAIGAGAIVTLSDADIAGGILESSGGGVIEASAGFPSNTLDGSTTPLTITAGSTVVDDVSLTLNGTIANAGTILLGTVSVTDITAGDTATLIGGGILDLAGPNAGINGTGNTPATLVNVNNTIEGAGQIGLGQSLVLVNEASGTINADSTAALGLDVEGSNAGLIEATNTGGLRIGPGGAPFTIDNFIGTQVGTIAAIGAGAIVTLSAADIVGGTLESSGGGVIEASGGYLNTLDGSTTPVTITAGSTVVDDAGLTLNGTIANAGTILLGGPPIAIDITAGDTATLIGGGILDLAGGSTSSPGTGSTPATLVNVADTIEGGGGISFALINEAGGTIDANSTLQLGLFLSGNPAAGNAGLIEATNTGGLSIGQGTIDNFIGAQAGTIAAIGAGAIVTLSGAKIVGGTLESSGGGVIEASGGTLDGSTTPVTITAGSTVVGGAELTLNGTIANAGTIIDNANIRIAGGNTVTLSGGGVVDLAGSQIHGSSTTPATLDNVNNTIEGFGRIGLGVVASAVTLALTNEAGGTIDANANGSIDQLVIQPGGPGVSNAGLMEGTGSGGLAVSAAAVTNTGTIQALDGSSVTFDSRSPISGTGILRIGAGSEMSLGSTVASGQTIEFSGSPDVLAVSQALSMNGTIEGFGPLDTIHLLNVAFNGTADVLTYSNSTLTISNNGTTLATFDISGPYTASNFTLTADPKGGTDLTTDIMPCFAHGTRIATELGEAAVEELRVGDRVLTAAGAVRPVVWIGDRQVDCRRHPRPGLVWPVRICVGAFGEGLPQRDLLLSPDHAVFSDGVLIPVKHLVNGVTVVQEQAEAAHYFHIELASHDVLLAEGLPVESYLDTGNRAAFGNGIHHAMLHPDFTARSWDDACAPLCVGGPALVSAKQRLLGQAERLGHATANEPDLHVQAGGRTIRAAAVRGKLHQFLLPARTREVCICSRSGVPAEIDPASEDRRRLGVGIGGIFVAGKLLSLDSSVLAGGFHAAEQQAAERWCWTDGTARLLLPEPVGRSGPLLLELFVRDTMRCWRQPIVPPQALASHCEPKAKQSRSRRAKMDCFAPLAMTSKGR